MQATDEHYKQQNSTNSNQRCKKFLYNRSIAWCFSPVMELIKESRILFDKIPSDRSSFSFCYFYIADISKQKRREITSNADPNFSENTDSYSNSWNWFLFSTLNLTIIIMIKIVFLQPNSISLNRKLPVAIHACIRNNKKDNM